MADSGFIQKLKDRWEVNSGIQVIIILIVFAITGTSTMFINRWLLDLMGIGSWDPWYIYYPVKVLAILIVYNVLLLLIGAIFGQFKFFSRFERKFFGRLLPFLKKD